MNAVVVLSLLVTRVAGASSFVFANVVLSRWETVLCLVQYFLRESSLWENDSRTTSTFLLNLHN
jgi:hypothetical protein